MLTDEMKAAIQAIAQEIKDTGKKYFIIHYIGANADTSGKQVSWYHKIKNGWKRDGYHIFVNDDGKIERLEPTFARVNGCRASGWGKNSNEPYIGVAAFQVCFETLKDLKFSKMQEAVLIELIRQAIRLVPDIQIGGHREFPDLTAPGKRQQTACPGFSVSDWLLRFSIPRKNIFYEVWKP